MAGFEIIRKSGISLSRQITLHFKQEILAGRLKPGERLDSTRALAAELCVSRNTVCEAYEILLAEGYITCRPGAAPRVSRDAAIDLKQPLKPAEEERKEPPAAADFKTGQPDVLAFPIQQWQNCICKAVKALPIPQLAYSGAEGSLELRREIAAWLYRSRSMTVPAKDIFITTGATQALHILAGLLKEDRKKVIVEDPCHTGMLRVLQSAGCTIEPVPVDSHGIVTDMFKGDDACAVYVTPSHQFPLGGILPADRRAALVSQARLHGFYIIEDDYDSEFRYCGMPVSPLCAMDPQHVIYVGTFSKIMFPAIRIGYTVLPEPLQKPWARLRTYTDVQNPPLGQAALAEFMHTRKLDRHIHKMSRLYAQKRKLLLSLLEEAFGTAFIPWGDAAGLHIALQFPGVCFDGSFRQKALLNGLRLTPLFYHSIKEGAHTDKLLLGYGHLSAHELKTGVSLLHQFLKECGYIKN